MKLIAQILPRIQRLESLVKRALSQAGSTPRVQHGQVTLSNGISGAISAPGLTATSSIVLTKRAQSGDVNTVDYSALDANRVFGAAGSFKATALVAGGGVQIGDDSTLDYIITF